MASRREQNMKYRRYSGRVNGNLAYDPAYEERQRRLRREREYEREHERQREEFMRPPQRKVQKKAAPVRRQREKVSLGTLCGFMALAAMVALMIMCRAQLTEISAQVVSVQKEISALEDEHVALLTRYEKTFDLTTIKEAAAAAGMAKDDDEGRFQMGYGILNGAELVGVDHISSDADGEKLTKTTGEDDFGDDAGVRTGDDHSAGRLPAGQGETFLRGDVSGKSTALYIRGVSFFECLQNDF